MTVVASDQCVCGDPVPHFVPPSLGEPGFYVCEIKGDAQMGDSGTQYGRLKEETINNATRRTEYIDEKVDDMFEYHSWTPEKVEAGKQVRAALANAVKIIIQHVPPGPDRSTAIRKVREARMDANSAITHGGKY